MDFESLEPQIRTVALVGRFLQGWAILEYSINKTIGKTLGLTGLQELIVTKNISVRDKIHIARTVINLSQYSHIPLAIREEAEKTLVQVLNYAPIRNMMAHDMFMPSKDGERVSFHVVKAKGQLKIPDEEWTVEQFWAAYIKLNQWDNVIRKLNEKLTQLPANVAPTGLLYGLDQRNIPQMDKLGVLGSIPVAASPETDAETQPDTKGQ